MSDHLRDCRAWHRISSKMLFMGRGARGNRIKDPTLQKRALNTWGSGTSVRVVGNPETTCRADWRLISIALIDRVLKAIKQANWAIWLFLRRATQVLEGSRWISVHCRG